MNWSLLSGQIKRRLEPWLNSPFRRHIASLATGTAAAQAISLVSVPILSRLYSPEDYGAQALYTAFVNVPAIIACGRYEVAIVLPEQDDDALNVFAVAVRLAMLTTVIIFLLPIIHFSGIYHLDTIDTIGSVFWLFPFNVLLTGIFQALSYWASRHKRFHVLSINRIIQALAYFAFAFLFYQGGASAWGLIVANFLSLLLGIILVSHCFFQTEKVLFNRLSRQTQRRLLRQYADFPKIDSISSLADAFQTSAVAFLISNYFGQQVLGAFSLTNRLLKLPSALISSAIGQVFYGRLSTAVAKKQDIFPAVQKVFRSLMLLGAVFFLPFIFAGPSLVTFIVGERWTMAGIFSMSIACWSWVNFAVSPISHVPTVLGRQRQSLRFRLMNNVLILAPLLFVALTDGDPLFAIQLMSACAILGLTVFVLWCRQLVRHRSGTLHKVHSAS